jgi:uncharacterized membrane protein
MDSISQTLINSLEAWMATHPVLAWVMSHPLWSIALFFITLLLCWGLLGAIARLIQQLWLLLLQAPLKLLRWLFGSLFKALPTLKTEEPQGREQRLMAALDRLEALQQEQELLMQEVKTMLKN